VAFSGVVGVALVPVFFVLAFAVGEAAYAVLGYRPENADAPLWVDLVTGVVATAVCLVPCVALWMARERRRGPHRSHTHGYRGDGGPVNHGPDHSEHPRAVLAEHGRRRVMSNQNTASQSQSGGTPMRGPADIAYRRAWWSLALYPLALVAAFVIGEGLITLLTDDVGDPAFWQVLVAGTPALIVFTIPGILAVIEGRKAMRLGRTDGKAPAIVGAVIAIAFLGQNILSYVIGLIFD
jgi:hypothetical protein